MSDEFMNSLLFVLGAIFMAVVMILLSYSI